ncbi:MAG: hypothetical protein JWM28_753 [Chitinophagaceae bacterium]|nr:hypothetical protein [Chitinophagaceae bacterium]
MKKSFIYLLVLAPLISLAQNDNISGIPIPLKNGKVFYEKEYILTNGQKKEQLYAKAVKWFKESFPELKESLMMADKAAGKIAGHGIFKIIVSESGNYYWIKPVIAITVADGKYTFQSYDYYEKPIEKGISNEYSKIEYRWWDFRRGKPWSTEDQPLFKGIDEKSLSLTASLELVMNQ